MLTFWCTKCGKPVEFWECYRVIDRIIVVAFCHGSRHQFDMIGEARLVAFDGK